MTTSPVLGEGDADSAGVAVGVPVGVLDRETLGVTLPVEVLESLSAADGDSAAVVSAVAVGVRESVRVLVAVAEGEGESDAALEALSGALAAAPAEASADALAAADALGPLLRVARGSVASAVGSALGDAPALAVAALVRELRAERDCDPPPEAVPEALGERDAAGEEDCVRVATVEREGDAVALGDRDEEGEPVGVAVADGDARFAADGEGVAPEEGVSALLRDAETVEDAERDACADLEVELEPEDERDGADERLTLPELLLVRVELGDGDSAGDALALAGALALELDAALRDTLRCVDAEGVGELLTDDAAVAEALGFSRGVAEPLRELHAVADSDAAADELAASVAVAAAVPVADRVEEEDAVGERDAPADGVAGTVEESDGEPDADLLVPPDSVAPPVAETVALALGVAGAVLVAVAQLESMPDADALPVELEEVDDEEDTRGDEVGGAVALRGADAEGDVVPALEAVGPTTDPDALPLVDGEPDALCDCIGDALEASDPDEVVLDDGVAASVGLAVLEADTLGESDTDADARGDADASALRDTESVALGVGHTEGVREPDLELPPLEELLPEPLTEADGDAVTRSDAERSGEADALAVLPGDAEAPPLREAPSVDVMVGLCELLADDVPSADVLISSDFVAAHEPVAEEEPLCEPPREPLGDADGLRDALSDTALERVDELEQVTGGDRVVVAEAVPSKPVTVLQALSEGTAEALAMPEGLAPLVTDAEGDLVGVTERDDVGDSDAHAEVDKLTDELGVSDGVADALPPMAVAVRKVLAVARALEEELGERDSLLLVQALLDTLGERGEEREAEEQREGDGVCDAVTVSEDVWAPVALDTTERETLNDPLEEREGGGEADALALRDGRGDSEGERVVLAEGVARDDALGHPDAEGDVQLVTLTRALTLELTVTLEVDVGDAAEPTPEGVALDDRDGLADAHTDALAVGEIAALREPFPGDELALPHRDAATDADGKREALGLFEEHRVPVALCVAHELGSLDGLAEELEPSEALTGAVAESSSDSVDERDSEDVPHSLAETLVLLVDEALAAVPTELELSDALNAGLPDTIGELLPEMERTVDRVADAELCTDGKDVSVGEGDTLAEGDKADVADPVPQFVAAGPVAVTLELKDTFTVRLGDAVLDVVAPADLDSDGDAEALPLCDCTAVGVTQPLGDWEAVSVRPVDPVADVDVVPIDDGETGIDALGHAEALPVRVTVPPVLTVRSPDGVGEGDDPKLAVRGAEGEPDRDSVALDDCDAQPDVDAQPLRDSDALAEALPDVVAQAERERMPEIETEDEREALAVTHEDTLAHTLVVKDAVTDARGTVGVAETQAEARGETDTAAELLLPKLGVPLPQPLADGVDDADVLPVVESESEGDVVGDGDAAVLPDALPVGGCEALGENDEGALGDEDGESWPLALDGADGETLSVPEGGAVAEAVADAHTDALPSGVADADGDDDALPHSVALDEAHARREAVEHKLALEVNDPEADLGAVAVPVALKEMGDDGVLLTLNDAESVPRIPLPLTLGVRVANALRESVADPQGEPVADGELLSEREPHGEGVTEGETEGLAMELRVFATLLELDGVSVSEIDDDVVPEPAEAALEDVGDIETVPLALSLVRPLLVEHAEAEVVGEAVTRAEAVAGTDGDPVPEGVAVFERDCGDVAEDDAHAEMVTDAVDVGVPLDLMEPLPLPHMRALADVEPVEDALARLEVEASLDTDTETVVHVVPEVVTVGDEHAETVAAAGDDDAKVEPVEVADGSVHADAVAEATRVALLQPEDDRESRLEDDTRLPLEVKVRDTSELDECDGEVLGVIEPVMLSVPCAGEAEPVTEVDDTAESVGDSEDDEVVL